jgi:hypothetical protein
MRGANHPSGFIHVAVKFARRVTDSIKWRIVDRIVSDENTTPYVFLCARVVLHIHKPFIIGRCRLSHGPVLARPEAEALIGRVAKTSKNLNNDIGLPLAVVLCNEWFKGDGYHKLASLCMLPYRVARLALASQYAKVLVLETKPAAERVISTSR